MIVTLFNQSRNHYVCFLFWWQILNIAILSTVDVIKTESNVFDIVLTGPFRGRNGTSYDIKKPTPQSLDLCT